MHKIFRSMLICLWRTQNAATSESPRILIKQNTIFDQRNKKICTSIITILCFFDISRFRTQTISPEETFSVQGLLYKPYDLIPMRTMAEIHLQFVYIAHVRSPKRKFWFSPAPFEYVGPNWRKLPSATSVNSQILPGDLNGFTHLKEKPKIYPLALVTSLFTHRYRRHSEKFEVSIIDPATIWREINERISRLTLEKAHQHQIRK